MSAILSPCGRYRYRLERNLGMIGHVIAFFGVNPSTADAEADDQTTRKLIGFAQRFGARRYLLGNVFAYRATNVHDLAGVEDPLGPENAARVAEIASDADVLVLCWGSKNKLPKQLRGAVDVFEARLCRFGKPVRAFGITRDGDPLHPLMLGYATKLQEWRSAA